MSAIINYILGKLNGLKLTIVEWLSVSASIAFAALLFLLHLKDQQLQKAETQVLEDQVSKKEDADQAAVDAAKKALEDAGGGQ